MSGRGVVTVATIGLQLHEQSMLKCVFNLSAAREQSYALAAPDQTPDILLVDGDIPEAVNEWRLRCKSDQRLAGLPTVMVTKAEPPPAPDLYPLKRPIVASRVYTVLDPIAAQLRGSDAAARVMHHRALVVDDSPTTRKQIELELERLGARAEGEQRERNGSVYSEVRRDDARRAHVSRREHEHGPPPWHSGGHPQRSARHQDALGKRCP